MQWSYNALSANSLTHANYYSKVGQPSGFLRRCRRRKPEPELPVHIVALSCKQSSITDLAFLRIKLILERTGRSAQPLNPSSLALAGSRSRPRLLNAT